MKRIIVAFLILILVMVSAACGGKKETVQPISVPTEAPAVTVMSTELPAAVDVPTEESAAEEADKTGEELKPGEENLGPFRSTPVDGVIEMPAFGMRLTLPESVRDYPMAAAGMVMEHFAFANLYLVQEDDPEDSKFSFLMIYAYPDELDQDGILEHTGFNGITVSKLGNNDALYYYGLRVDKVLETQPEALSELYADMSDGQKEMHQTLVAANPEMLEGVEILDLILPKMPKAAELESFEIMDYVMPDLDGNDVRLGDLIKKNKVTMLNVWGIECGPCMLEMPALEKLHQKYQDQGFNIIGLTSDLKDPSGGIDPKLAEDAKEIIADLKVDYQILAMTQENYDQMKIAATPTTYFVDSTGSIIGDPIMGSKTDAEWEKLITNALASVNQ